MGWVVCFHATLLYGSSPTSKFGWVESSVGVYLVVQRKAISVPNQDGLLHFVNFELLGMLVGRVAGVWAELRPWRVSTSADSPSLPPPFSL